MQKQQRMQQIISGMAMTLALWVAAGSEPAQARSIRHHPPAVVVVEDGWHGGHRNHGWRGHPVRGWGGNARRCPQTGRLIYITPVNHYTPRYDAPRRYNPYFGYYHRQPKRPSTTQINIRF